MRGSSSRARWVAALPVLAAQPTLRWWALTAVLNRLAPAMGVIGFVLAGEQATGSLADGALLLAASAGGFALAAPWRGRALDRRELRGGLQRDCLLAAAGVVVLAAAITAGAPLGALVAFAAGTGVATAALEGGFRALLPAVVEQRDLPRASALEAMLGEASFLAGPALAGLVAHVAGPVWVLALMAAASAGAALAAVKLPRHRPREVGDRGQPGGVWRLPGVRVVCVLAVAAGACVGLLESAMPPRAVALGLPAAAAGGYVTAAYVGSLAGGLVATVTAPADPQLQARRAPRRAVTLFVVLATGLTATAAAPGPVALAAASVAAGATLAPLYAVGAIVLHTRVPARRQTEGFAVYIAAQALGGGLGNAVTSQLLTPLGGAGLMAVAGALALLTAAAIAVAPLVPHRCST